MFDAGMPEDEKEGGEWVAKCSESASFLLPLTFLPCPFASHLPPRLLCPRLFAVGGAVFLPPSFPLFPLAPLSPPPSSPSPSSPFTSTSHLPPPAPIPCLPLPRMLAVGGAVYEVESAEGRPLQGAAAPGQAVQLKLGPEQGRLTGRVQVNVQG